jgi:hypothetical protein
VFVLFISFFPYYYPLDVDPVAVYYWLAAGIVLKLPTIDLQEQIAHASDDRSARLDRLRRRLKQAGG